jgi:hypothetical protein
MTTIWQQNTFLRDELRTLIGHPPCQCVSLFAPIERAEPARRFSPRRFEHLLRQAEQRLRDCGLNDAGAHDLLAPARQQLNDSFFWARKAGGLAIFATANLLRIYELPLEFEPLVVVAEHPHITPLLPLVSHDGQFYLLTIGLGGTRLFAGTRYGLSSIALEHVPASLRDALKYDEFAKNPQWHSGVPGSGGERGPIFHGQGARDAAAIKEEALRYFQQVEHGVRHALHNAQAPLLLAGIAYLLPLYRAANTYAHVLEAEIATNPDELGIDSLQARAWALVEPYFERAHADAIERYLHLRATQPALATNYLRAIVPAAYQGRVETLFLAAGQQQPGTFDPVSGELALYDQAGPRNSDLLNLAAIECVRHDSTIYAGIGAQMPESGPLAAIMRY